MPDPVIEQAVPIGDQWDGLWYIYREDVLRREYLWPDLEWRIHAWKSDVNNAYYTERRWAAYTLKRWLALAKREKVT